MGKKTHEKNINGRSFRVTEFPAMRGWKTFVKLSRGIMPALASAAGSLSGEGEKLSDLNINGNSLAKAAEILLTELDENKSEILIRELFSLTWVDGQEVMPQFDTVFQANYGMLIKALVFVIEVNYKSFLGENGVKFLKDKAPKVTVMEAETAH